MKKLVDEGVEDVGDWVDGDVARAGGIATDGLTTRFALFQTALPDLSKAELGVDIIKPVDHPPRVARSGPGGSCTPTHARCIRFWGERVCCSNHKPEDGGSRRNRTCKWLITNQLLCLLSQRSV